jgi:hypothetical protein
MSEFFAELKKKAAQLSDMAGWVCGRTRLPLRLGKGAKRKAKWNTRT